MLLLLREHEMCFLKAIYGVFYLKTLLQCQLVVWLLSDGGMLHSKISFFVEWVDWTSDPNSIRQANQSGFHSQYKSFFLLDHKTNNIAYILLYLHELISPG